MSYVEVRLWFSHIVELWFGVCRVLVCRLDDVLLSQDVRLWLYFIDGLVSHGLGLGLGFSHIVELWFFAFAGS